VHTLVREGFVIAADGRSAGPDGTVFSDSVQKIFPIKSPGGVFAYSISGTVEVITDDGQQVAVSLVDEVRKSAESLTNQKTKNLTGYAVRLCRPICRALKDARESGRFSHYPTYEQGIPGERGDTIIRICIDGFRDGYPSSVVIRLFHENDQLCEPEILAQTAYLELHRVYGRPGIARLLWRTKDERFAAYRGRELSEGNVTLQDAVERSRYYIQACTDPEALAIDSACHAIGGHIHIATITPSDGFKWVVEPISE
jgi:hypothetical protein